MARRETGILAAGISLIPQLNGVWLTAVGVAVLAVIVVVVAVAIVRSARKLLIGEYSDTELVAYRDDRETGILLKGTIENVSLRASTIHTIVDALTSAIPPQSRQDALYGCGHAVGRSWASEFRRALPRLEIEREDVFRQLLKWSEYDATAGMGRLTVAVNPATGEGLITLANGFLSRASASFPLNWWFAGYLAGTLHELIERPTRVEVLDPTNHLSKTALFQVVPEGPPAGPAAPGLGPVDPRSVALGKVWLGRWKAWRGASRVKV